LMMEPGSRTIHPSAVIAEDATIGNQVKIGPGAVIEPGVFIGRNSVIEAGCYVGRMSRIGQDTVLYPRVVVYHNVEIGNRVIVHDGSVIGADGFGFVCDGEKCVKFTQAGGAGIAADVEIG